MGIIFWITSKCNTKFIRIPRGFSIIVVFSYNKKALILKQDEGARDHYTTYLTYGNLFEIFLSSHSRITYTLSYNGEHRHGLLQSNWFSLQLRSDIQTSITCTRLSLSLARWLLSFDAYCLHQRFFHIVWLS